jgi:hypothetical protein
MAKLSPVQYDGVDRSFPFPGRSNLALRNFQLQAEFASAGWYSTGLYLPAGVVSTVVVDRRVSHCWLQIGSHAESITAQAVAWRRWPSVTVRFEIVERTIQIGSPFGGIIYVTCDENPGQEPLAIVLTFCHVGRHPFFTVHDPGLWNETKDLDAPWAELETRFIIFTLPATFLRSLPDLPGLANRIDVIVNELLKFMSDDSVSAYRVIFDVTVTDSMANAEAIFLPIETLDDVLLHEGPSVALLSLFQLIAERSIPPLGFPTNAKSALASLAAYSTAESIWPPDEFRSMLRARSPLFAPMVQIYSTCDKSAFPSAFADVRAKMHGRANKQYFLYKLFVKRLAHLTGAGGACHFLLDNANVTSTSKVGFVLGPSESLAEYHLQRSEQVAQAAPEGS